MMYSRVCDPVYPKDITLRGVEIHLLFLCPGNKAVLVSLKIKVALWTRPYRRVSSAERFRLDEMLLPVSLI